MKRVFPIKDKEKLTEIQEQLQQETTVHGRRVYLLFMTGIYTGLRVSDLVRLQVRHVQGEYIRIVEQKTGKEQSILIADNLRRVFDDRLAGLSSDEWLFNSRKRNRDGSRKHIETRDAQYDMDYIKNRFNINFAFSCHSMRKTYAYWRYKTGTPLETLRQFLNHASEKETRRYICIDEEERNKGMKELNFGFTPKKPMNKTKRKGVEAEPLVIKRRDNSKQGKMWGEYMTAQAEKRREKKNKTK